MKKLTSMYKRYMFHPILYKTVTRTSIVAVLMLLWQRYVSDGTFTIWEAPTMRMRRSSPLRSWNPRSAPIAACSPIWCWACRWLLLR